MCLSLCSVLASDQDGRRPHPPGEVGWEGGCNTYVESAARLPP